MSMQEHIDPAAPPGGLDAEPAGEKPPTHPYSWRAAELLMTHLDACVLPLGAAGAKAVDDGERRRVLLGMLEAAWEDQPRLTLGQLLERMINESGGADLSKLPDVALVHVLATMAQLVEPF